MSTAPPLASADTSTGVKVGRAFEMGFISMWAPAPAVLPAPVGLRRGTAADRGARKGFESPVRLPGPETPVRTQITDIRGLFVPRKTGMIISILVFRPTRNRKIRWILIGCHCLYSLSGGKQLF